MVEKVDKVREKLVLENDIKRYIKSKRNAASYCLISGWDFNLTFKLMAMNKNDI